MALSETARDRLADIVELQPTKNAELADRWGLESGKAVHGYLEDELADYYYRNDNSLICATPEAAELVDVAPGVEHAENELILRVPELERRILEVLPEPDERSMSVLAILQALRASFDADPTIDEVRQAVQGLRRKGAVEVTYRVVPTFALARPRAEIRTEAPSAHA